MPGFASWKVTFGPGFGAKCRFRVGRLKYYGLLDLEYSKLAQLLCTLVSYQDRPRVDNLIESIMHTTNQFCQNVEGYKHP